MTEEQELEIIQSFSHRELAGMYLIRLKETQRLREEIRDLKEELDRVKKEKRYERI